MKRPPKKYVCEKCGYLGDTSEHEGCDYLAWTTGEQLYIDHLETELETERMRLAGCGVAALGYFDGCKEEYRSASLDDTLRLYAKYEKQSAALKLAKDAFSAINIEAKTFMSYENARNNFSDDTDERKAYERAMVKASELIKQALAAIDALKGE